MGGLDASRNDAAESRLDPRFAGVTGLGPLRELYTTPRTKLRGALIILLLIVLPCGYVLYQAADSLEKSMLAVAGALVALILLFAVFGEIWMAPSAVALYERGLAYHDRRGLALIRWEDIERLDESWAIWGDEYGTSARGSFHIWTRDGRQWKLPGELADRNKLWAVIVSQTGPSVLMQPLALIHSGETLYFSPFHVSREGLEITEKGKDRFAKWSDLRAIEEFPDAALPGLSTVVIWDVSTKPYTETSFARIRRDKIVDPVTFLALCRHFIARPDAGVS